MPRLQAGREPLTNATWQRAPGTESLDLFPFTRKIDTVSSNSYIIVSEDHVIIIDPGGLPEQTGILAAAIRDQFHEKCVPVTVLFSHVHVDHCIEAMRNAWYRRDNILLGAHVIGAKALERGDVLLTQSKMLGEPFTPVQIPILLFNNDTRRISTGGLPGKAALHQALTFFSAPPMNGREVISRQVAQIGGGDACQIFHTPGHSPDSISIQAGRSLFIGDLLFAASPGMAGMVGWDQRALLSSIQTVLAVINTGEVDVCCPGHGRILTASEAINALSAVYHETLGLTGIVEMNPERAKIVAGYAETLTERLSEIFTVITGRLLYLGHILQELEEAGIASGLLSLERGDLVDNLLQDFHNFGEDYRKGKIRDIHVALKAAQVVRKIEGTLETEQISAVIDPTLIRRAERLISDYMGTIRGFRLENPTEGVDLARVVRDRLKGVSSTDVIDDGIVAIADDEEAFVSALVGRLACIPVFDGIGISFEAEAAVPGITTEEYRVSDLFATILEDLAGSGAEDIRVEVRRDENVILLSIESTGKFSSFPFSKKEMQFLDAECHLCNGQISFGEQRGKISTQMAFPISS